MQTQRLSKERQERFLAALAGGSDRDAAAIAGGASISRFEEARRSDPEFAAAWDKAQLYSKDNLEKEARRRAIQGTVEPLINEGKIVHDDNGNPIALRRYSDDLLIALLRAYNPDHFRVSQITEVVVRPRWLGYVATVLMICAIAWVVDDIAKNLSFILSR